MEQPIDVDPMCLSWPNELVNQFFGHLDDDSKKDTKENTDKADNDNIDSDEHE